MTDTKKLQSIIEAALRDTSNFIGKVPQPALPASNPSIHRSATSIAVRAGFKPVTAVAGHAHMSNRFW